MDVKEDYTEEEMQKKICKVKIKSFCGLNVVCVKLNWETGEKTNVKES